MSTNRGGPQGSLHIFEHSDWTTPEHFGDDLILSIKLDDTHLDIASGQSSDNNTGQNKSDLKNWVITLKVIDFMMIVSFYFI